MPPITKETFIWFFKDADWKNKFLIGSLMFLAGYIVPMIGWLGIFVALGYCLAIWRALLRGEPPVPPKWETYDAHFLDGLKATLAGLLYNLPVLLSSMVAFLFLFGGVGISIFMSVGSERASNAVAGMPFLVGLVGFFAMLFLMSGLGLFVAIPYAIAVGQYVRTGKISAGYRLGEVWKIFRANVGGFIGALVLVWAVGIGLSILMVVLYFTVILCLLNQFVLAPILFYQTLMWAYLFGVAYREGCLKAGITLDIPAK